MVGWHGDGEYSLGVQVNVDTNDDKAQLFWEYRAGLIKLISSVSCFLSDGYRKVDDNTFTFPTIS